MQSSELISAKAKATRAVASRHHEEYVDEMRRLGWIFHEHGQFRLDSRPGRLRQWVRSEGAAG